jgi:phosphoadenosine phosphosulfate reductase
LGTRCRRGRIPATPITAGLAGTKEDTRVTNSILEEVDIERLQQWDAESLLRYAFETFGQRAAIGTSLQKTGVVMIHMAQALGVPCRVFFIDTLVNNPETYELCDEVEKRYGISIERFAPTDEEVEALRNEWGQYAHYFARTRCCHVRKSLPMQRAMKTLDAWIAGLRADQSDFRRKQACKVSWARDPEGRKILKINPLLDWTAEQIDDYTREHDLPYNKLYDYVSPYGERFTTIGCRVCHIPIQENLDSRAGKFPWEQGARECGLHIDGSGI